MSLVTSAPAKVNLTLRITGRRADGYHLIESLMVPVSLCDRLDVRVGPGPRVVRCAVDGPVEAPSGDDNLAATAARAVDGPVEAPSGDENLAAAAAHAVVDELRADVEVELRLTKHIPLGSGLGGGSSDAAAVLRTLPSMLGRTLRPARLADLAVAVGADVPFFLACRPAVAMGIGEILAPVPRFPDIQLVIAVPAVQVSTAWAYRNALPALGVLTSRPSANTTSLRLRLKREPIASLLSNDFEAGVEAAFPDVLRLKRRLEALGAGATVMSGSGSAVVGIFPSARRAEAAAAALSTPPDRAYAVRVLRRRPAVTDDGR